MQTSHSSQCQLFQLHIDAFLDGELEPARAAELQSHADHCAACRQELAFAQRLHQAVLSLPILDCRDTALEPVDRLFGATATEALGPEQKDSKSGAGFRAALGALLGSVPFPVRIGVPVAVAVLLAVGLSLEQRLPDTGPEIASQSSTGNSTPQYTEAEVVKAMQDLSLALDYLEQISERTEVMIEDRFLLRQLEESINASFTTNPRAGSGDTGSDGPI